MAVAVAVVEAGVALSVEVATSVEVAPSIAVAVAPSVEVETFIGSAVTESLSSFVLVTRTVIVESLLL